MGKVLTGILKWTGIGAIFGIGSATAENVVTGGHGFLTTILVLAAVVGIGALAIWLIMRFFK